MNIALLLSGGTGTRLGAEIPKQYIQVNNRAIISYSIELLAEHGQIDAIQIVAEKKWHKEIKKWLDIYDKEQKFMGFSNPGSNRQISIYHGLQDIMNYAGEDDLVLIHDAARPKLSKQMISNCIQALGQHDGVLPVLPMKDTVYFSNNEKNVSSLLDRSKIYAGQAPELFKLQKYYHANEALYPDKICQINGSTEPAVMYGMDIVMIPGEEQNDKITTKNDLERFQAYMDAKK